MTPLLTMDEVMALHEAALMAFGGSPGVRDANLLDSALSQPLMTFGGEDLYPSLFDKVAALGFGLISNHAFVDGNKRVGFASMAVVLQRNGYLLECSADDGEAITLAVAASTANRERLTTWVHEHVIAME